MGRPKNSPNLSPHQRIAKAQQEIKIAKLQIKVAELKRQQQQ